MAKAKSKSPESTPINFSKRKILTFQRYSKRVDLLSTLLNDTEEYTLTDVDSIINDFLKGQVK